jgi:diguanylate cyclase (GGDEF)-like protein
MPQLLIPKPSRSTLRILGDALDFIDVGVLLLDGDMSVLYVNRQFAEMFAFSPALLAMAPTFRSLIEDAAARSTFLLPEGELPDFEGMPDAAVRVGSIAPTRISLGDGRRLLLNCAICPNGGRLLTYSDISRELQCEAHAAVDGMTAEMRFSSEMLEQQAASLASLAEETEESVHKSEEARLALEFEVGERRKLEAQLRIMATTDGLTGALNRSEFLALGKFAAERPRQPGQSLAMLMLDVDHFKAINDRYGHGGGDHALRHLVATLREEIRSSDLLGRLGGEEFAVLLPSIAPEVASQVAERLRSRVAGTSLPYHGRSIEMTVSIGLATWDKRDRSIEQIMARADAALYRAKAAGRNLVTEDFPTLVA